MGESLVITSTEPHAEVVLSWREHDTVRVVVRDEDLVAEADMWWNDAMGEPKSLCDFFADIAANWKGWTDVKEWKAAEHPFKLSGSHDGLGHIALDVQLGSGWHEGDWRVQSRILIDAGLLDEVATRVLAFARNPPPA